jgi:holo-[acyl-carrier protein] synthase
MVKKTTKNFNIQGLGTDIIEVQRIREAIERHGDRFLNRLFTEQEKKYCCRYKDATPHFAGRFAAKEAVLKAFGTGLHPEITWKEIEIVNDPQGKPEVQLSTKLAQALSAACIFLSISHCQEYATATAIVVR